MIFKRDKLTSITTLNTLMIRHMMAESFAAIRQTLTTALGWLFGFPMTLAIYRTHGLIEVIGRPDVCLLRTIIRPRNGKQSVGW